MLIEIDRADLAQLVADPAFMGDGYALKRYGKMPPLDLVASREDIFAVLDNYPLVVTPLLKRLQTGMIDGAWYSPIDPFDEDNCALCLFGTVAVALRENRPAAWKPPATIATLWSRTRHGSNLGSMSPAEALFWEIHQGQTPDNDALVKLVFRWVECYQLTHAPIAALAKVVPIGAS